MKAKAKANVNGMICHVEETVEMRTRFTMTRNLEVEVATGWRRVVCQTRGALCPLLLARADSERVVCYDDRLGLRGKTLQGRRQRYLLLMTPLAEGICLLYRRIRCAEPFVSAVALIKWQQTDSRLHG